MCLVQGVQLSLASLFRLDDDFLPGELGIFFPIYLSFAVIQAILHHVLDSGSFDHVGLLRSGVLCHSQLVSIDCMDRWVM